MEKNFAGIVVLFVGIFIAVIMVTGVVLPTAFAPTVAHTPSVSNSALLTNVSYSNGNQSHLVTTTNANTGITGTLTVTYQSPADRVNVTYGASGTVIAELDGTSPDTLTVSVLNGANRFNYTSPATTTGGTQGAPLRRE